MQTKLLKDIVKEFAGPGAEKLVDILFEKKNVNEFLIANKLALTINQTRNILYKLGEEGMVNFIRKKDKKKGGWYTYFWTLDAEKSLQKYKEKTEIKLSALQNQLNNRQTKAYFYCPNCEIEYNEESALQSQYTCSECGEVLEVRKTNEMIGDIQESMKKLESLKSIISKDLEEVQAENEKTRSRKMKSEQTKKEKEKKEKAAKRSAEKAKAKKDLNLPVKVKKPAKEKVKKPAKAKPSKKTQKKKKA